MSGAILDPEPVPLPKAAPEATQAVAASINAFAFDYYARTRGEPGNQVFSPASMSLAFAMTYAGARGETAAQMAEVFHFPADTDALLSGFATTTRGWNGSEQVELAIANRLFGEKTRTFNEEFLGLTSKFFSAPLTPMDFKHDAAGSRVAINDWVSERTKTRIQDLLPPQSVTEDTRLVLTNAIYFKADWQSVFDKESTRTGDFFASAGTIEARMMVQRGRFAYAHDPGAGVKLLEMPYAGNQLGMLFVLPDEKAGLAKVESTLSPAILNGWAQSLKMQTVDLLLPQFKIEPQDSVSMRATLEQLGMTIPFDEERADFSAIASPPPPLFISDAFHKAFIEVNEKGTEAAAATAVVMADGAGGMPAKPARFQADRPFLFFLRDRTTGALLFMGRLENPTQ